MAVVAQFERRRVNPEAEVYERYFRGDARVHAMGPPFEDDYGVRNMPHGSDKLPNIRRSVRQRPPRRMYNLEDLEPSREPDNYSNSMADLFARDDNIYDALQIAKSGRPKGPWSGLLSTLFGCVGSKKPSLSREQLERRAKELFELARRQQSALSDKQDTIDLLQWKLRQLQLFGQEQGRWRLGGSQRFTNVRTARDAALSGDVSENGSLESLSGYLSGVKLVDNDQLAVMVLFDTAVTRTRIAVRCFCRIFMRQMEASGYRHSRFVMSHCPS